MAAADVPSRLRPRLLVVALLVVHLEVLALVAAGGFLGAEVVLGRAESAGPTLATAAFAWVLALLLGLSSRALWRFKRWGRGPVVTWQLLQGAVGVAQFAAAPVLGVVFVVSALVALVGLLAPASIQATAGEAASAA